MKSFFKFVFATIIGLFIFFVLSIILLFSLAGGMFSSKDEVHDNSILKIDLSKQLLERESDDLFAQFSRPFSSSEPGSIGLLELRKSIKEAAKNPKIKGILLSLNNMHGGLATIEELRNELIQFKKSGKFVLAYADSYTEGAYYLASVADKIYLPTLGMLEFNGLNAELMFFKRVLDKLGVKPEVFKVGKYKSAVEPFISEKMSEYDREQLKLMLNSLYGSMLKNISSSRKIPVEQLEAMSDSMKIRSAEDALKAKLITDVGYLSDVESYIKKRLKFKDSDEDLCYVNYWALLNFDEEDDADVSGPKIAVIFAVGEIRDGEGDDGTIGSETIIKEIKKAREDSSIKAVVLRINSPGGSALASDIIWKEVVLTNKVKPVIASMSDVAASGGYYIAAGCNTILAQPTTITGSIGVFGMLFNGKEFLNEKIGITTDREQTGPFADIGSFTRPVTNQERQIIQQEVEHIYRRFVSIVSEGRKSDTTYINEIAQGRVWTGNIAKTKKLVDKEAGLDEAIALAASKAKITKYKVVDLPETPNLVFKQLFNQMSDEKIKAMLTAELGDAYPYLKRVKDIKKMEGVQARLPYEMDIR